MLIDTTVEDIVVPPPGLPVDDALHIQWPAVIDLDTTVMVEPLVGETEVAFADRTSPTCPAAAFVAADVSPLITGSLSVGPVAKFINEEFTTLAARVVPVREPAPPDDDTVHDPPSVQRTLLIVIPALTRSAFVTRPVAVNAPVTVGEVSVAVFIVGVVRVGVTIVGDVARTGPLPAVPVGVPTATPCIPVVV